MKLSSGQSGQRDSAGKASELKKKRLARAEQSAQQKASAHIIEDRSPRSKGIRGHPPQKTKKKRKF